MTDVETLTIEQDTPWTDLLDHECRGPHFDLHEYIIDPEPLPDSHFDEGGGD